MLVASQSQEEPEVPFDPNNPPSKLKNLSDKKKRQWVHVFNSCYKKNPDEKKCHMQAWGTVKKSARIALALSKVDKKIIESFINKRAYEGEGKWLDTDGRSLYKIGMGGGKVAVWRGSKIVPLESKFGARSDDMILRYLKKVTPKFDIGDEALSFETGGDQLYRGQYEGWIVAYVPWEDKPVGSLEWSVYDGDYSPRYRVKMVKVRPDYRRSGIATELYKELFKREKISKRDLDKTMLTDEGASFKKNLRALALTPGMAEGCGCDVVGNCGCEHPHSELPTVASERIITELRLVTRDIRAAKRCRNYG